MYHLSQKHNFLAVILILSFLFSPFAPCIEASIQETVEQVQDKVTNKVNETVEQVQQPDWWYVQALSKVTGFLAGKAGGVIGAALGYVIGASVGGPLTAGVGATIGFRIGDIVTKTFAKALGKAVAEKQVKTGEELTVDTIKDSYATLDKGSLTAASLGAVIGDFIGSSLGVAAGVALMAGGTTIALPLLGVVSAAYIGGKIGKMIGSGIGRWIGTNVLKKSYDALAANLSEGKETKTVFDVSVDLDSDVKDNVSSTTNKPTDNNIQALILEYERAYMAYTNSISDPNATEVERKEVLARYRQAYDAYISAVSITNSK